MGDGDADVHIMIPKRVETTDLALQNKLPSLRFSL
jgi:D-ribose pyranose/furanose isomerase RbsD